MAPISCAANHGQHSGPRSYHLRDDQEAGVADNVKSTPIIVNDPNSPRLTKRRDDAENITKPAINPRTAAFKKDGPAGFPPSAIGFPAS